ncbi:MAG: CDP-diacylglycerol--glycerol-3-phosphate 3-phosphatidyltransferase [Candidatus Binatia bacterium]
MSEANEAGSTEKGRSFNVPNFLTMLRIAAIPVLVWLLSKPSQRSAAIAFAVYFLASMTDIMDGYLARRYGLETPLGKLLDPLADKLLVVSSLIMLALVDRSPGIPGWFLVIIVGREIAVTGLRSIAASEGMVLGAEASGKMKMVLQSIGIHALILHYNYFGINFYLLGMVMLVLATAVGLWSAASYHITVFRGMAELRAKDQ